jgi:L-ascorbate metabolism protein UlaG (beta-lactamase superfamily)
MLKPAFLAALMLCAAPAAAAPCEAAAAPLAAYEALTLADAGAGRSGDLRVRFLGISSLLLDDGDTQLMVDGYFSRPSFMASLFGRIASDTKAVEAGLQRAEVGRLSALLVAHAHQDHALDAPEVIRLRGGRLVGSESVANIGRGQGVAETDITVLRGGETLTFGAFEVTAYAAPHSRPAVFTGHIREPLESPAKGRAYREGRNFSFLIVHRGLRVLVHPSSASEPGLFRNVRADVVVLGIARLGNTRRGFAENYWTDTIRDSGARVVIPVHWDDFSAPVTDRFAPTPGWLDNVRQGFHRIACRAERDQVALRLMPPFAPVDLRQAVSDAPARPPAAGSAP